MVEATASVCRHHWLLSEPRQDVVHGVCIHCRAQRDYPAHPEGADRCDDYEELAQPPVRIGLTAFTEMGWLKE